MWEVRFKDSVAAKIKELYKKKELTNDDREVIANWKGFRSSSFSYSGRIIYEVKEQEIVVIVVKLTVDHDYKRGKE